MIQDHMIFEQHLPRFKRDLSFSQEGFYGSASSNFRYQNEYAATDPEKNMNELKFLLASLKSAQVSLLDSTEQALSNIQIDKEKYLPIATAQTYVAEITRPCIEEGTEPNQHKQDILSFEAGGGFLDIPPNKTLNVNFKLKYKGKGKVNFYGEDLYDLNE